MSAITNAAGASDVEVIQVLLSHATDVDLDGSREALNWAAARGRLDTAKLLIEHGFDVNAATEDCIVGRTPLIAACQSLYRDIDKTGATKLLVENGADVNARNKDGWTAAEMLLQDDSLREDTLFTAATGLKKRRRFRCDCDVPLDTLPLKRNKRLNGRTCKRGLRRHHMGPPAFAQPRSGGFKCLPIFLSSKPRRLSRQGRQPQHPDPLLVLVFFSPFALAAVEVSTFSRVPGDAQLAFETLETENHRERVVQKWGPF